MRANQALARAGSREKITGASLERQYRDALEAGDEREAARLEYREPGVHIGPHNVARAERGVALERTATARAVEDRNQEFKSDRADVREMAGSLERLRGDIAEVARKLAAYVRARLEGSPASGWRGPANEWRHGGRRRFSRRRRRGKAADGPLRAGKGEISLVAGLD